MTDISETDVIEANRRLHPYIRRTPILRVDVPTPTGEVEVVLKLEQVQLSGSFKARGILNMALRAKEGGYLPGAGLVIASGGNAGIAAAVAGGILDTPTTVAVPADTPQGKLEKLRALGARVVDQFTDHRASNSWADDYAMQSGALRLHAYDTVDVIAGAGTLLLEALSQESEIGSILVAVGGGGLVSGTIIASQNSDLQVVAVEPSGAPTLRAALSAGEPVDIDVNTIAQDSLGASRIGSVTWDICRNQPIESVLVSDQAITTALEWLWEECRLLVEDAGACALAAIMDGVWQPADDRIPLVVVCGANVENPL